MKAKGSYTIEAAILFPIILFLIIHIIYAGWWLHNQCVLEASAITVAVHGCSICETQIQNSSEELQTYAEQLVKKRLIGQILVETDVKCVGGTKVTVHYTGKMQYPFSGIGKFFGKEEFLTMQTECSRTVVKTSKMIQAYQILKAGEK